MQSLLRYDLLPRLITAVSKAPHGARGAPAPAGASLDSSSSTAIVTSAQSVPRSLLSARPEVALQDSWRLQLSEKRRVAEEYLGLSPSQLVGHPDHRRWASDGMQEKYLFPVDPIEHKAEYDAVSAVFTSDPTVERFYAWDYGLSTWQECFDAGSKRIVSVQRVEREWPERNTLLAYKRVEARRGGRAALRRRSGRVSGSAGSPPTLLPPAVLSSKKRRLFSAAAELAPLPSPPPPSAQFDPRGAPVRRRRPLALAFPRVSGAGWAAAAARRHTLPG